MDHIDQAVYETVHNSEMPAKEIARRIGMSHQILINKANPQCETHKLTLLESVAIQLVTGSKSIHRAVGVELSIDDSDLPVTKNNLLESVLSASKEHGDVVGAVQAALADGRFTLREKERCQKEIDESMSALSELRKSIISHF